MTTNDNDYNKSRMQLPDLDDEKVVFIPLEYIKVLEQVLDDWTAAKQLWNQCAKISTNNL